MAIAGLTTVGRPFAVWPATLQVMPEGVLDGGMGRFFLGVRISNGGAQAWPATEVRISGRGRRVLAAAGVVVSDGWSAGDAAAVAQTNNGEWVSIPVLAVGAVQMVFFKLDVNKATPGLHQLELELRDPTAPAVTIKTTVALPIAQTTCHGTQRTFTSVCDQGTLTAALSAVTMDQESFRSVLGRARAVARTAAPGTRTPAETERLRLRFRALLCGEESDVCGVMSDITTSCGLPAVSPPGPPPASGSGALAIQSDQASNLGDRDKITDGSVFSNHAVVIGTDAIINGKVTSGGDVTIGDRSRVQGDVNAAGLIRMNPGGGAVITGAQNQHAPFVSMTIPTKTVTPGTTNVTVNSGQGTTANPFVIAPGSYGTITVNSNNVISMAAGVYQIGQLIINADVTLNLSQTSSTVVDVRVQTNLSFGDRLVVKLGTSPPGTVAQFYSNQTTEIRVGTDIASFPITLTAPQGTIHVFSRTNVMAQLIGKTVTLEPDVGAGRVPVDDWLGTGASGLEFLGYPTGLQFSVAYNGTFFGTTGPQAFGLLSWKALLANAMLLFDLGLPGAVSAELVSTADEAVVGTVKTAVLNAPTTAPGSTPPSTQAGSVDAAVATVRGNRALGSPWLTVLDAVPGEVNATPVNTSGGLITTAGSFLSNAEIDTVIAQGSSAPNNLKVYKSGAGTGVTRGIISGLLPVVARDDETGTLQFINQLLIVPDPAAPPAGGAVAGLGDSGALWIQTSSNRVVGLGHTVGSGGAIASRFQDVVNALQIQLA
ncbi:MAG: polymer-forming cytoskeletal protein [Polyangia bacterium]